MKPYDVRIVEVSDGSTDEYPMAAAVKGVVRVAGAYDERMFPISKVKLTNVWIAMCSVENVLRRVYYRNDLVMGYATHTDAWSTRTVRTLERSSVIRMRYIKSAGGCKNPFIDSGDDEPSSSYVLSRKAATGRAEIELPTPPESF